MNLQESYEWNPPEHLPPVDCPLVILVAPFAAMHVERISYLQDKAGQMDYRSAATGHVYTGRFPWSYP